MRVIELTGEGLSRVTDGRVGMTFIVDSVTTTARGLVVHVRDYRYPNEYRPYQIWSIGPTGYKEIHG